MSSSDRFHLHISRRAMATDFEVLLPHSSKPAQIDAAVLAMEMLEQIESVLTVYRPDSEVSRINREASRGPVKVGALVRDILRHAVRLSEATEGAFDVTSGPLIDAWGFTTRSGRRPSDAEVEAARSRVGWRHLEIDDEAGTVRFHRPDMRINFGAIGKGYALDRIALRLRQAEIGNFLLHGGNSSVLAMGDATPVQGSSGSGPAENRGWRVGLRHPTRPHLRAGGVWLRGAALATSGSGKQHFHFRGRRYGHVIDPRTGYPAGDLLSLSLISPSATDADALATGLFVSGREAIERYAAEHPECGIVAVAAGEREASTRVETWNLSEEIWSPEQAGH